MREGFSCPVPLLLLAALHPGTVVAMYFKKRLTGKKQQYLTDLGSCTVLHGAEGPLKAQLAFCLIDGR